MEALTISAANLDTIEKNLGAVANELSGVISNVSSVNSQVNKVEEQVNNLNDEIKNLVKEIRENTIITNARQSIMYNNSVIEKKYGYYDKVRRTTESLLEAIKNSNIDVSSLINLKQDLLLNNPNYWLANALAALTSWILNDKANTEKELNNALTKDSKKTSLFFCLINFKLDRIQTSINWLNKYLNEQDPQKLNKDFITILNLATSGYFCYEAKNIVLEKISTWFNRLNNNKDLQDKQISIWQDYISNNEEGDIKMPFLELTSPDISILKNNLTITSSYLNVLNSLNNIAYTDSKILTIDEIINNLIYDYESNEQTYQLENIKNNLIISCNGNLEEAEILFQNQKESYIFENDLLTLLSNIIIHKDSYKCNSKTQKIALSLIKDYILTAYEEKNKKLDTNPFRITINSFTTATTEGKNIDSIKNELNNYLDNLFNDDDRDLFIFLLITNLIGIMGIFITLNNKFLNITTIIFLILGNILLFHKIHKRNKIRNTEKEKQKNIILNTLERVLAETIDYKDMMKEDEIHYYELINFLKNLNPEDYIKNNNERNINIGE